MVNNFELYDSFLPKHPPISACRCCNEFCLREMSKSTNLSVVGMSVRKFEHPANFETHQQHQDTSGKRNWAIWNNESSVDLFVIYLNNIT